MEVEKRDSRDTEEVEMIRLFLIRPRVHGKGRSPWKSLYQAWKIELMVGWRTIGGRAGFGRRNGDVSFVPL